MRGLSICFFINFFVYFHAKSQQLFSVLSSFQKGIVYDTSKKAGSSIIPSMSKSYVNYPLSPTVRPVPPSFYFNSLGFFCRKELQMEKAIKFPVKFRLGSVAFTDQMEGKGKRFR